jgi:hypothetical protein
MAFAKNQRQIRDARLDVEHRFFNFGIRLLFTPKKKSSD